MPPAISSWLTESIPTTCAKPPSGPRRYHWFVGSAANAETAVITPRTALAKNRMIFPPLVDRCCGRAKALAPRQVTPPRPEQAIATPRPILASTRVIGRIRAEAPCPDRVVPDAYSRCDAKQVVKSSDNFGFTTAPDLPAAARRATPLQWPAACRTVSE